MADDTYYQSLLNRDRLIHILDADLGTCEALSVLFRLEGFQTAFTRDIGSFFDAFARRHPDVAIINFEVGEADGIVALHKVKAHAQETPVFMLEDIARVDAAVAAMKAGASDVITKPIDSARLLTAVADALRYSPPRSRRQIEVRGFAQLTPREREVLQLITNGQSNKEAGRELGISPRTVEVHRARVMEKLGARNTADLMRIVLTS